MHDCFARCWQHEVVENWLLFGHAQWSPLTPLCTTGMRQRWHMMCWGVIANVLRVWGLVRAQLASSDDKDKRDIQYIGGHCVSQGNIYRHDERLLRYSQSSEKGCVRLVNMPVMVIMKDRMSRTIIAANHKVTYNRYIGDVRMTIRHQEVFFLLAKLERTVQSQFFSA